jgi:hypothetical protein
VWGGKGIRYLSSVTIKLQGFSVSYNVAVLWNLVSMFVVVSVLERGHMGSVAIVMLAGVPIRFLSGATYIFFL